MCKLSVIIGVLIIPAWGYTAINSTGDEVAKEIELCEKHIAGTKESQTVNGNVITITCSYSQGICHSMWVRCDLSTGIAVGTVIFNEAGTVCSEVTSITDLGNGKTEYVFERMDECPTE